MNFQSKEYQCSELDLFRNYPGEIMLSSIKFHFLKLLDNMTRFRYTHVHYEPDIYYASSSRSS